MVVVHKMFKVPLVLHFSGTSALFPLCWWLASFAHALPLVKFRIMGKRGTWGFKQNLKQQGNPFAAGFSARAPVAVQEEGRSKLALKLLERWCWGSRFLPVLQQLAAAAVEDGLTDPFLFSSGDF